MHPYLHLIWQRIPHVWRRRLFEQLTYRLAPALPEHPPAFGPPWIVAGAFKASTGLGEAARLAVLALEQQIEPVFCIDLTEALQQKASVHFPQARINNPVPEKGTLLVFANPPVSSLALKLIGRKTLKHTYRIGCWVWERELVPPLWHKHAHLFHALAAPSHFAAKAIVAGTQHTVGTLIHPVAVHKKPQIQLSNPSMVVGFIGDVVAAEARKNPLGLLEAFAKAFHPSDDVVLRLHLHGLDTQAPSPVLNKINELQQNNYRITLTGGVLSETELDQLFQSLDLYCSLHTSEGFGLTLTQAMLYSIPVVATDWSASCEYIDYVTGYPVPYSMVTAPAVVDDKREQLWAEADVDGAALALREAFLNPQIRQKKGIAAREKVQNLFSSKVFLEQLKGLKCGF